MDYGHRLRTYIDPRTTEPITPPRHAIATSELYDGTTAGIPVVAIANGV